jgi:hypothetical protein
MVHIATTPRAQNATEQGAFAIPFFTVDVARAHTNAMQLQLVYIRNYQCSLLFLNNNENN